MLDKDLKQLKHDLLKGLKPDVNMILQKKHITGIKVDYNGANADNSCIEMYFALSLDYGKSWKMIVITIDNHVLLPNMCHQLDVKANIPEKYYYPPAVGEARQEVSNLNRARLRVLYVVCEALNYYRQVYVDRWGPHKLDWDDFKQHKRQIVEVDTIGNLKYSYDD